MSVPVTLDDKARKCRAAVLSFVQRHPDCVGRAISEDLYGASFTRRDITNALHSLVADGRFWHRHAGCSLVRLPKSRHDFWVPKLEANRCRDERNLTRLQSDGWQALVIWECELGDLAGVTIRVEPFLKEPS